MREVLIGNFYKDLRDGSKSREIKGRLIGKPKQIGTEGKISFYDLGIEVRQKYPSIGLRACVKEITIDTEIFPECDATEMLKKYLWFKKIGLPVVPLLMCDGKNKILMTDMATNARLEVIDKHLPRPENFEIKNTNQIIIKAHQSANLAFENGSFLYQDAYAVVVNKQSHLGELCLIDIGRRTKIIDDGDGDRESAVEEVHNFIDCVL